MVKPKMIYCCIEFDVRKREDSKMNSNVLTCLIRKIVSLTGIWMTTDKVGLEG